MTGFVLAAAVGTACADGTPPSGLTFENWREPGTAFVLVPFDSIEAAPRLRLDSVADLDVPSPTGQMIRSVVTLSDGTLALTVDAMPSIEYLDSAGSTIRPGTELGRAVVPMLVPGRGDTLFVKDADWLRVAPDGDIIDTLRVEGALIGTLEDGSAVTWDMESGRKPEYGMETMRVTARQLPPDQIGATDPRVQPLFAGMRENLAHFGGPPMPWARWTVAGVAAGKLWVSPTGGPRLVGIGSDGRAHRVIAWATPDTVVDTVEVRTWKTKGTSSVDRNTRLSEAVKQDRVAEIEAAQPEGRPARVVFAIQGGRDGTIWVQLRREWGSTAPHEWMGLDTLGTVRGVLTVPDGFEVLEFGADYLIVVPYGRKRFRRHRIVEAPAAETARGEDGR